MPILSPIVLPTVRQAVTKNFLPFLLGNRIKEQYFSTCPPYFSNQKPNIQNSSQLGKEKLLERMTNENMTKKWDAVAGYTQDGSNRILYQQCCENHLVEKKFWHVPDWGGKTSSYKDLILSPPKLTFERASLATPLVTANMRAITGDKIEYVSSRQEAVSRYQKLETRNNELVRVSIPINEAAGTVNQTSGEVKLEFTKGQVEVGSHPPGEDKPEDLSELEKHLVTWFKENPKNYKLGGINLNAKGTLNPTSFRIRTQPLNPAAGKSHPDYGKGAILQFIAVNNHSEGDFPSSEYPYLIPSGYEGVLLVNGQLLMKDFLMPAYITALQSKDLKIEMEMKTGSGKNMATQPENIIRAEATGGGFNFQFISDWHYGSSIWEYHVLSGKDRQKPSTVSIPFSDPKATPNKNNSYFSLEIDGNRKIVQQRWSVDISGDDELIPYVLDYKGCMAGHDEHCINSTWNVKIFEAGRPSVKGACKNWKNYPYNDRVSHAHANFIAASELHPVIKSEIPLGQSERIEYISFNLQNPEVTGGFGGHSCFRFPFPGKWWEGSEDNWQEEVNIGLGGGVDWLGPMGTLVRDELLNAFKAIEVPEIHIFKLKSLFFPGENFLQFKDGSGDISLPGDLAMFGFINPKRTTLTVESPLKDGVIAAGGKPVQLKAMLDGHSKAVDKWDVRPGNLGKIDAYGYYTPPATTAASIPVLVTATFEDKTGEKVASALLYVVPSPLAIRMTQQKDTGSGAPYKEDIGTFSVINAAQEERVMFHADLVEGNQSPVDWEILNNEKKENKWILGDLIRQGDTMEYIPPEPFPDGFTPVTVKAKLKDNPLIYEQAQLGLVNPEAKIEFTFEKKFVKCEAGISGLKFSTNNSHFEPRCWKIFPEGMGSLSNQEDSYDKTGKKFVSSVIYTPPSSVPYPTTAVLRVHAFDSRSKEEYLDRYGYVLIALSPSDAHKVTVNFAPGSDAQNIQHTSEVDSSSAKAPDGDSTLSKPQDESQDPASTQTAEANKAGTIKIEEAANDESSYKGLTNLLSKRGMGLFGSCPQQDANCDPHYGTKMRMK